MKNKFFYLIVIKNLTALLKFFLFIALFFFFWLANKMPTMIFKPLSQYLLSQRRYKYGTEDSVEDCDVNSVPVPRKQLHRRKALY